MSFGWYLDPSICFGAGPPRSNWSFDPALVLPLLLLALLYGTGFARLWSRSAGARRLLRRQALLFLAGWSVLAVALVTPIHRLGEMIFTAHMIEHELLMAVAAPLLAASAPLAAAMWALPRGWRRPLARAGQDPLARRTWSLLTRPAVATVLHGAAIWVWHVPALFEAALDRGFLHYLQHASFFGTGLLFWWVLLPRPGRPVSGGAVMHLFVTTMHTGLLGVLLLFSPRLLYPLNAEGASLWNLTALEDQQLAGLVMWVPAGLVYGGAALLLAGVWIAESGGRKDAFRPA